MPPNAKLREMQQNTHGLEQLSRAATPHVPNQNPMPQLSKQMLNACCFPPMHIIVRLLPGRQRSILPSNEWHNYMNPAFISAVMAPNLKIKEITTGMRQPHPYLLGVPMVGIDQYGYITPAFLGSPW